MSQNPLFVISRRTRQPLLDLVERFEETEGDLDDYRLAPARDLDLARAVDEEVAEVLRERAVDSSDAVRKTRAPSDAPL